MPNAVDLPSPKFLFPEEEFCIRLLFDFLFDLLFDLLFDFLSNCDASLHRSTVPQCVNVRTGVGLTGKTATPGGGHRQGRSVVNQAGVGELWSAGRSPHHSSCRLTSTSQRQSAGRPASALRCFRLKPRQDSGSCLAGGRGTGLSGPGRLYERGQNVYVERLD